MSGTGQSQSMIVGKREELDEQGAKKEENLRSRVTRQCGCHDQLTTHSLTAETEAIKTVLIT